MRVLSRSLCFLLLLPAILAVPRDLEAQAGDSTTIPVEKLTAYTKAWLAIGELRDQTQAELAKPKNKTIEAQQQLKDTLRLQRAEILKQHGLTDEEYDHITQVISRDPAQRKTFDDIAASLAPKSGGAG